MSAKTIKATDNWLDKITKLIPAEAIALFLATANLVATADLDMQTRSNYTLGLAIVVAILVPILLYKVYAITELPQHIVAIVAFALWVFVGSFDSLPNITEYPSRERLLGSIGMIFFTAIAPLFVKPRE